MGCEISVVITYHNREQYIDGAIQSVLAQTLQPLEIILVNDCSRESSRHDSRPRGYVTRSVRASLFYGRTAGPSRPPCVASSECP